MEREQGTALFYVMSCKIRIQFINCINTELKFLNIYLLKSNCLEGDRGICDKD